MGHNYKNARRLHYNKLSFTQMCKMAGIDPIQRIKLLRLIKGGGVNKSKNE